MLWTLRCHACARALFYGHAHVQHRMPFALRMLPCIRACSHCACSHKARLLQLPVKIAACDALLPCLATFVVLLRRQHAASLPVLPSSRAVAVAEAQRYTLSCGPCPPDTTAPIPSPCASAGLHPPEGPRCRQRGPLWHCHGRIVPDQDWTQPASARPRSRPPSAPPPPPAAASPTSSTSACSGAAAPCPRPSAATTTSTAAPR